MAPPTHTPDILNPATAEGLSRPQESQDRRPGMRAHPRIALPSAEASDEQLERSLLAQEIGRLQQQTRDLQNALLTSNEHSDFLQEHLYSLSASLQTEVQERQAAEARLQRLMDGITREKGDLEVLVQILIDQGDDFAEKGEQADVDSLTQIANRRRFDRYLLQEWHRHTRLQQPLSLLILDVDHFKLYNDCYGHPAGDECLRRVAKAISQRLRTSDLAARYGGEEFAIVLPHTDSAGALVLAERVQSAVAEAGLPHQASLVRDRVTLSIGIGCVTPPPENSPDARQLIEAADRSLYMAKRSGRDQVCYSEKEQDDRPDPR